MALSTGASGSEYSSTGKHQNRETDVDAALGHKGSFAGQSVTRLPDRFVEKQRALNEYFIEMTKMCRKPVLNCLGDPYQVFWLSDLKPYKGAQSKLFSNTQEDVWLSLPKVTMPMAPECPAICREWIDGSTGTKLQQQITRKNHATTGAVGVDKILDTSVQNGEFDLDSDPDNEVLHLKDYPEVQRRWEQYLAGKREWQEKEHNPWDNYNKTYQKLRDFAKIIEENRENYEIVLALGLVIWNRESQPEKSAGDRKKVYHHAITVPCSVKMDIETGTIAVTNEGDGAKLSINLDFCGSFGENLEKVRAILSRAEEDPWSGEVAKALEALSNVLNEHGAGCYIGSAERSICRATNYPQVVYAPALYLRPRSVEAFLNFAEEFGGILQSDTPPSSGAIRRILEDEENGTPPTSANGEIPFAGDHGDEILMPLPSNAEQRRIVEVLNRHDLILVQGPPGTGKSATIANLICHLLSRGKRILITAQMDKALRPLKEKLPEEIVKLCIVQIGDNANETQEVLRKSVSEICERQAMHNPQMAQLTIDRKREQLRQREVALEERRKHRMRIEKGDCQDQEIIGEYRGKVTEIVELVRSHNQEYGWFADAVDLANGDTQQIACLHEWLHWQKSNGNIFHLRDNPKIKLLMSFPEESLRKALETLQTHRTWLRKTSDSLQNWARKLFVIACPIGEKYSQLHGETCAVLAALKKEIVKPAVQVSFAPRRSFREVEDDLIKLIHYYENYGRWQRLFHKSEIRSCGYLMRNPLFHGKPISDLQTADRALAEVETLKENLEKYEERLRQREASLRSLIGRWLPVLGTEQLPEECAQKEIEEANRDLKLILDRENATRCLESLVSFGISDNLFDSNVVGDLCEKMEVALLLWKSHQLEEIARDKFPMAFDALKDNPRLHGELDRAFEWKYAQQRLDKYFKETDSEAILRDIDRFQREKTKAVEELVSALAWKSCLDNLSDGTLRDLRAFSSIKIPKTGKQVQRKRAESAKYLQRCALTIPAWIMPIDRLWNSVKPASQPLFDVAIVDEASQCGVETLFLCYLAKKIIVVGDDKQITPTFHFRDVAVAVSKRQKHLGNFNRPEVFDFMDGSLYGIVDNACDSRARLMLREHFRCMPEIIHFSNEYFYGGKLIPMKRFKSDRLPPLERRYVSDGFAVGETNAIHNPIEAESIARQIAVCLADGRYGNGEDKPKSLGVITLQGKGQKNEIETALLKLEVDEKELARRLFRIGDAREFQGDERDIIFLSMVAGGAERRFRALTTLEYQQRYNVAMSRAKEQVWLFHSIDRDETSPGCLRHLLLQYFYGAGTRSFSRCGREFLSTSDLQKKIMGIPREFGNQPGPFGSWFEIDVADALLRKGYDVIPQYQVANYRIDLVVEGSDGLQIPIECDGDFWHGEERWNADQLRQEVLERCGWGPFIRIRECKFRSRPQHEMERVTKLLHENKILPRISSF
jgi:hypothetical protein